MENALKQKIDLFVTSLKCEYPNVQFVLDKRYDEYDDYMIYHDYNKERDDMIFRKQASILIRKIFFDNDIFNVGFCYDHENLFAFVGDAEDVILL